MTNNVEINGITLEQVENYLSEETHDDLCACVLREDVCVTYGEHWRARLGTSGVEAAFDAILKLSEGNAISKASDGVD